jgi:hypothetical protein
MGQKKKRFDVLKALYFVGFMFGILLILLGVGVL